MSFIFNLTIREIRSSWRRLLFFFLCIAIGVGSVVALRSLIQNLSLAVGTDARALLTADFEVSTTNTFTPDDISRIESVISKSTLIEARNETITTAAMARPSNATQEGLQFIELKGIEPPFPLVGTFNFSNGKPFDFKILENKGAVVAPLLLEKLNLKIGDKIKIGETDFEIRATFDEEPGGQSGFRLGPRVFIEKKAFEETGLTRSGSRIRRRILYRTSDNPTPIVKEMREALKGTILTVQNYRETQENMGEQFVRTENYLSLTGLLILVLGGVGVWNVARVFVEQKRKTVAVLKCLGADSRKVIFVYLLQILSLGFLGSLFGIFLAQATLWLVGWRLGSELPEKMSYNLQNSASLQGMILGVLISLLFSLLPLLQIRQIKPSLLLRDTNNVQMRRLDWTKTLFALFTLGGILGIAVWQAGSWKVGTAFLVGLGVTSAILYVAAIILTKLLRQMKKFSSFSISQAVNSLYRPGNQTRIVLLAVGLGAFVVIAVQSLQTNLVREFDFTRNQTLPNLFMVDIQRSQIDGVKKLTAEVTGEELKAVPTVRTRIALVDGVAIDYQQKEVRQQQGQIGREFAVTYRPKLDENESVIAGKWWDEMPSKETEVSVVDDMARMLKVGIGSIITFDVLGRKINATVTSIRKIDVRNTRTVFMFVFRPGTLDTAPQTFALPIINKIPAVERARFQRRVIDAYPNVQIFDVQDILTTVTKLINNFVLAISFVGSFVMLTGILILIGSVSLTKSQRIYENAILKTLGARRGSLFTILFTEYAILGLLAGLIGAFFATLLSFAVTKYILNFDWEFDYGLAISGVLITALLVTLIGTLASFDVLFKKPLSILRSQ
ncbi:MAG TPA: FtsX-like permease family protein [Pyrinomonadaceae bacterium]|nr:FtsX-like permease family protein [Pyrinomonadaceae bacterium]